MSSICTMLPHNLVTLADEITSRCVALPEHIVTFVLDFTQIHVSSEFCMLLSLTLAATYPVTSRHITSENQSFRISVVVRLVELLDELSGLFEYLIVISRPNSSIHLRGVSRRVMWVVRQAEGNSVIVNS